MALGYHQSFSQRNTPKLGALVDLPFFLFFFSPFFFTLHSGSRSLVCVSFQNLFIHFVVRFMFWKVSQTSLGLEKAGLDSGFSPATYLPGRGGGRRPV